MRLRLSFLLNSAFLKGVIYYYFNLNTCTNDTIALFQTTAKWLSRNMHNKTDDCVSSEQQCFQQRLPRSIKPQLLKFYFNLQQRARRTFAFDNRGMIYISVVSVSTDSREDVSHPIFAFINREYRPIKIVATLCHPDARSMVSLFTSSRFIVKKLVSVLRKSAGRIRGNTKLDITLYFCASRSLTSRRECVRIFSIYITCCKF